MKAFIKVNESLHFFLLPIIAIGNKIMELKGDLQHDNW